MHILTHVFHIFFHRLSTKWDFRVILIRMKKIILAAFLMFFIAVIVGGIHVAWQRKIPLEFWDAHLPMPSGEKVSVLIRSNQSARDVAQNFVDEGVVQGTAADFSRWLARFGVDRRLLPGRYELIPSSGWDVARQMRTAVPAVESATIIPGTNIYTFEDVFSPPDGIAVEMLLDDSLYPKDLVPLLPASREGRLAFLLPDTYSVPERTPEDVISAASSAWFKEFGKEINSADEAKNLAIIASLIEREALWDDERPKIAGVIYNRIEKKMLLQIDAAVVYAHRIGGRKLTRVLFKDLEIDSPYNLYRFTGLTPEPICTPSVLSWKAALAPERHDWFYYVADKTGRHVFGRTNSEHVQNIKKVRQ